MPCLCMGWEGPRTLGGTAAPGRTDWTMAAPSCGRRLYSAPRPHAICFPFSNSFFSLFSGHTLLKRRHLSFLPQQVCEKENTGHVRLTGVGDSSLLLEALQSLPTARMAAPSMLCITPCLLPFTLAFSNSSLSRHHSCGTLFSGLRALWQATKHTFLPWDHCLHSHSWWKLLMTRLCSTHFL